MIAVDTNVLVHAHRREGPEHAAASDLLRTWAQGAELWAIPWPCAYEFFSTVTNPKIFKEFSSTPEQAWEQLAVWSASPSLRLLGETEDFFEFLVPLARRSRVRGTDHSRCAHRSHLPGPRSRQAVHPRP